MVGPDTSAAVRLSTPAHHSLLASSLRPCAALPSLPPHALASLDAARAAALLPPLRGRAAIAAARDVPPAVLRPHWLGLARAHAAALKARPGPENAAALAALVAAARPFPALGGPAVAAVAAVTSSAVAYVNRSLAAAAKAVGAGAGSSGEKGLGADGVGDHEVAPKGCVDDIEVEAGKFDAGLGKDSAVTVEAHVLAVLALGLAIAEVSPQQLRRPHNTELEAALWALVERSLSAEIRSGAALLLAALPSCQPANARVDAMGSLLARVTGTLANLARALSPFQPGAPANALLGPDAAQDSPELLIARFDGLCQLLIAAVTCGFAEPVPVPVHAVVSSLLEVLDFAAIDPYVPEKGKMDVVMVARVVPAWRLAALKALSCVVPALGRSALLPHGTHISRVVAHTLATSTRVVRSATRDAQRMQSAAGLAERSVGYEAALACVQTFGSPAVEAIIPALSSCLAVDLPVAVTASQSSSRGAPLQAPSLSGIDTHMRRPKKRQRHAGGLDEEEARYAKENFASSDYDPVELKGLSAAPLGRARIQATKLGLAVAEAVFGSRCMIPPEVLPSLLSVEHLIASSLFARGDLCLSVVRAVSSCILGGGSGRMSGHCAPILNRSLSALRRLSITPGLEKSVGMEVRHALAACEALVHSRGPSIVTTAGKSSVVKHPPAVKSSALGGSEMIRSLPAFKQMAEKQMPENEPTASGQDIAAGPSAVTKNDSAPATPVEGLVGTGTLGTSTPAPNSSARLGVGDLKDAHKQGSGHSNDTESPSNLPASGEISSPAPSNPRDQEKLPSTDNVGLAGAPGRNVAPIPAEAPTAPEAPSISKPEAVSPRDTGPGTQDHAVLVNRDEEVVVDGAAEEAGADCNVERSEWRGDIPGHVGEDDDDDDDDDEEDEDILNSLVLDGGPDAEDVK